MKQSTKKIMLFVSVGITLLAVPLVILGIVRRKGSKVKCEMTK